MLGLVWKPQGQLVLFARPRITQHQDMRLYQHVGKGGQKYWIGEPSSVGPKLRPSPSRLMRAGRTEEAACSVSMGYVSPAVSLS